MSSDRLDLEPIRRDVTRANDPRVQGEGRRVVTSRVLYAASKLLDEVERLRAELAETRSVAEHINTAGQPFDYHAVVCDECETQGTNCTAHGGRPGINTAGGAT